ncbi:YcgN family cysteine cluster protein [Moraxella nasicaprae]|uniref:YcgN family cysteine cluster protein n=1 Tax=Moraxella nasicaprae TaxID=2904122 RepID=A0ABY6F296_9GAMM|nr:YcgN family cysteine cluster protein [Moraxella nasicaprae]UXZ04207.1 YcgN family cysteine cluster protein [Moraxella nasicaprae]
MTSAVLRHNFWQNHRLDELNDAEWEALCDGCGVCCLVKFLDEDDVRFTEYTDVACKLLDCQTGHCRDYAHRQTQVPDCIRLTVQMLPQMMWLPRHCAYKRLYLGQSLPSWHRLMSGQDTHQAGFAKVSVAGRCVSELDFDDEQIEERIVRWVKI